MSEGRADTFQRARTGSGSTADVSGLPADGHFWWEAIFPAQLSQHESDNLEFRNVLRCISRTPMNQKRLGHDITATSRCKTSPMVVKD